MKSSVSGDEFFYDFGHTVSSSMGGLLANRSKCIECFYCHEPVSVELSNWAVQAAFTAAEGAESLEVRGCSESDGDL